MNEPKHDIRRISLKKIVELGKTAWQILSDKTILVSGTEVKTRQKLQELLLGAIQWNSTQINELTSRVNQLETELANYPVVQVETDMS